MSFIGLFPSFYVFRIFFNHRNLFISKMFASRARQDHSGQCWFSNYRMMEEKVCTQCKISRSLDKFSVNKKTGILNKTCTECLEKKVPEPKAEGAVQGLRRRRNFPAPKAEVVLQRLRRECNLPTQKTEINVQRL